MFGLRIIPFMDYVKWLVHRDPSGKIEIKDIVSRNRHWVGAKIITKGRGYTNYKENNITNEYKFPEETEEELQSWYRAQKFMGHRDESKRTKMQMLLLKAADERSLDLGQ